MTLTNKSPCTQALAATTDALKVEIDIERTLVLNGRGRGPTEGSEASGEEATQAAVPLANEFPPYSGGLGHSCFILPVVAVEAAVVAPETRARGAAAQDDLDGGSVAGSEASDASGSTDEPSTEVF